jgi:hypothetical protein
VVRIDQDRVPGVLVDEAFLDVGHTLRLEEDESLVHLRLPARAIGHGHLDGRADEVDADEVVLVPVHGARLSLDPGDVPDGNPLVVEELLRSLARERVRGLLIL